MVFLLVAGYTIKRQVETRSLFTITQVLGKIFGFEQQILTASGHSMHCAICVHMIILPILDDLTSILRA
ncbi:hypothetical protein CR164_12120 [Prosthecochloris marina]|uniref:Uncharacterized protein n=1 Tax=Prosthecochloris marina TaxID=2017681 RepID=A0A317T2Z3_9CHLB|nr:hypothetical protein CR164_12120 [Prosthecochloris marina]